MKLSLLSKVLNSCAIASETRLDTFESVSDLLGKESTKRIFETYEVSQHDYAIWLDVIKGFAEEEGINIKLKRNFEEVASSVLENDPAGIDEELQGPIIQKLWLDYRSSLTHDRVNKVVRSQEEEEQLHYALNQMKRKKSDKFNESTFDRYDDIDDYDEDYNDEPYDEWDEVDDERYSKSDRYTPKYDKSTENIISSLKDYSVEDEEQLCKSFKKGCQVKYKKDGNVYTVEIPDGPGDTIGVVIDGRIRIIPSKELELLSTPEENEEQMSKYKKTSVLHDLLTGEKSKEHITKLQKEIENDGANAFAIHFSKSPRNPYQSKSVAYNAWKRGYESAAKEIWQPKKVEVYSKAAKAKQKKK